MVRSPFKKKFRAAFNKQYEALDDKRKEVKKQILAPYNEFEEMFNKYIKSVFDPVKVEVSQKVTDVENGLKAAKLTLKKLGTILFQVSKMLKQRLPRKLLKLKIAYVQRSKKRGIQ